MLWYTFDIVDLEVNRDFAILRDVAREINKKIWRTSKTYHLNLDAKISAAMGGR